MQMKKRNPIVVVMGHIDHGKTSLLAKIREAEMPIEAGDITQNISAFETRGITFIDTPGHEAFQQMRTKGAQGADVAIIVISAEEGIKPQTKESYQTAVKAKIPVIIAISKIDKSYNYVPQIKQEFKNDLVIELSSKTGQGINELLEAIRLLSEEIDLKINDKLAYDILENRIDSRSGASVDLMLRSGILKVGENDIKRLENFKGESIKKARAAMPVRAYGLKIPEPIQIQIGQGLKTIVKAGNQGTLEALIEILNPYGLNILNSGVGNITEKDLLKADENTLIIGFQVKIESGAQALLERKNSQLLIHNIVYKLEEELLPAMEKMTDKEIPKIKTRENIGQMEIIATFKNLEQGMIVGGPVVLGKAEVGALVDIIRNKEKIGSGKITELQHRNRTVSEVELNQEAGITFKGKTKIKIGDMLESYKYQ